MTDITYNVIETNYGNGRQTWGGLPRNTATLIGSLSIFFWATWPSLAVFAAPLPSNTSDEGGQAHVDYLCSSSINVPLKSFG
jgi:hypothetical protein